MQQTQTIQDKSAGLTTSIEPMKYLKYSTQESRSMIDAHPMTLNFGEQRLQTVVKTLAVVESHGEGLSALAHDARNMVTALGLYCELLEKPGVLTPSSLHYASELRLLSAASRRLVEKMVTLDSGSAQNLCPEVEKVDSQLSGSVQAPRFLYTSSEPIRDLALELRSNRNLLAALAGSSIKLHLVVTGCAEPVRLTGEDLTRILVNLVKNSAEAMPEGGEITIALTEENSIQQTGGCPKTLLLTISDNGHGIPEDALEAVFVAGFTTRSGSDPDFNWPGQHRGLGLSITRSILESNGGAIQAGNLPQSGARITIKLPVNQLEWATSIQETSQSTFKGIQHSPKHTKVAMANI